MGLVAGVPAHTCMVCHSRRGCYGGNHGIPTVAAAVVAWLVGLSAPAPVWARVPTRPRIPAAVVVAVAAMWAATVLAGIVAVVAGTVVGFPTAGSALAAVATGAVVGVVAVGEIQGPAVVRVWWCYSGGQRLTRRASWHCFRVGRS